MLLPWLTQLHVSGQSFWYCGGTVFKNKIWLHFLNPTMMVIWEITSYPTCWHQRWLHTSIKFAPITQFQGLEIYFLVNKGTSQPEEQFSYLTEHTPNFCFLENVADTLSFHKQYLLTPCRKNSFFALESAFRGHVSIPVLWLRSCSTEQILSFLSPFSPSPQSSSLITIHNANRSRLWLQTPSYFLPLFPFFLCFVFLFCFV